MLKNGRVASVIQLLVLAAKLQAELIVPFKDGYTDGVATIEVGDPAQEYRLLLDTGSANTWLGANKLYTPSSTSQATGKQVKVSYGSGSFQGNEYIDVIRLGAPKVAEVNQSIGVATQSQGFDEVDGILGLGPVKLTKGTLVGSLEEISTISYNLVHSQVVDREIITISHEKLIFGTPRLLGPSIIYAPITSTSPANEFWGIDASFGYGDNTNILPLTAGIIDHGTTLILLASDSYRLFLTATGATTDKATSLPKAKDCAKLKPLYLTFAGEQIKIPVKQYRWPADQNSNIGGSVTGCYLAVSDIGPKDGAGLDFIIGYNTLKHWTVVLDTDKARVGISTTGGAI